ncbi:HhH-GPD-type base excision DNA repair protein [Actinomycetospora sp. TBRC 11914]|uniref:HhH-GPD-type base excision DNA repair protein n=1 Tax=Actinomycetospora sp. TBRC 11914 TaxID=2729387 RepID=UPI00145EE39A|nr:HhH-GPD-type base excision DNA repair protein [Actinomycetospora sp. TBRC 11914]NMO89819.1 Fe-S cluster assembly protein HesB [Actinomycetospora sp. TBRC 11914]
MPTLTLAQDPDADAVLSANPLALLIGMQLDQQFPMERAFAGPALLTERIGEITAQKIADYDHDALVAAFTGPPALHRYPKSMAERVQAVCRAIVEDYDGDVTRIWTEAADGDDVFRRLNALPGWGKMKAQIFTALLGKQCGLEADGWRDAAGSYGDEGSRRSIADVVDPTTLAEVRDFKQAQKRAAKEKAPAKG